MDNWPSELELLEYPILDSTNAEAKRIAFTNQVDTSTWIIAHRQTDGRGSRGRKWFSNHQNLTASFLFYPSGCLKDLVLRTFTTSLALFDALVSSGVNPDQLILKWPNDVLLNHKKISGILLETCKDPSSKRFALIIGIGINLFSCPDINLESKLSCKSTTLKSVLASQTPKAMKMLSYLANSLQYWEKEYSDKGFSFIKDAWLNLSYPLRSQVTVQVKGEDRVGCFLGISDQGYFLFQSEGTYFELNIGDVFFIDG